MARQVSVQEFRRLAGAELAQRTDQILDHDEWGAALYRRHDGAKFVVSWGNRFAEHAGKHPPSNWGDSGLDVWVPPEEQERQMISPVLAHLRGNHNPQIRRPRSEPPTTSYPEVWLHGR
jgi:hypothetical protein